LARQYSRFPSRRRQIRSNFLSFFTSVWIVPTVKPDRRAISRRCTSFNSNPNKILSTSALVRDESSSGSTLIMFIHTIQAYDLTVHLKPSGITLYGFRDLIVPRFPIIDGKGGPQVFPFFVPDQNDSVAIVHHTPTLRGSGQTPEPLRSQSTPIDIPMTRTCRVPPASPLRLRTRD
jgi:hypothetical protein